MQSYEGLSTFIIVFPGIFTALKAMLYSGNRVSLRFQHDNVYPSAFSVDLIRVLLHVLQFSRETLLFSPRASSSLLSVYTLT